ncbi:hypothetical protein ACFL5V_01380 [Fibrobacterota bacterium]
MTRKILTILFIFSLGLNCWSIEAIRAELGDNARLRIASRLDRIEKRVDQVSSLIQDLEGEQLQKMEAILDRVTGLLQRAKEKNEAGEYEEAIRIVAKIEAIGKKTRKEIRRRFSDGKRLQKYLRRNNTVLEKVQGRLDDESMKKVYEIALNLHEKSKNALAEKEYRKSWRNAIACREHLIGLGKDVLNPDEKEAVKKRVTSLYKRTQKAINKAAALAEKSGNPDITGFVETAKVELKRAEALHQKGQDAKALVHLKKAQRIAGKIVKTASAVKNVSRVLERLEKRYARVGDMIKGSQDAKANKAYQNAGRHFETAKALAAEGKNTEAAKEAKLAVRLLGKAVHVGVKNDPGVAEEVKEELARIKEKVKSNLERIKASDNKRAQALGKQALKHLSRAKALVAKKQYKRALQHLFKASALSEKAVHVMNNRSNPELEEDTDIEGMSEEQ